MSPNTSRGGRREVVRVVVGSAGASGAFLGLVAALGVAVFWGFTVDDAWVTARVAWRIATGFGYRFNTTGPAVDAVTPLGWVFVLVPFARHSPWGALQAARYLGALAWIAAAVWFGFRLKKDGKNPAWSAALFATAPLGAWASSGMETGTILALSTLALGESWWAMLATGVVGALRPEMIPFCTVLLLRRVEPSREKLRQNLAVVSLVLGLPLGIAVLRQFLFGQVIPLSALAKPSDFEHGLHYGLGVLLFLGPTWLWIGPGWKDLSRNERWLALGVAVHFASIVVIGGDWMPLWRLAIPAMPGALWVATCLQSGRSRLMNLFSLTLGIGVTWTIGYRVGLPGRHVFDARAALIHEVSPLLAGSKQLAGLDVGWLGVATASDILDLAGITDPRIARLPGGHTTKKIPNSWFDSRQPDALIMLTAPGEPLRVPWGSTQFARGVENQVKRLDYWQDCTVRGVAGLNFTHQSYVVIRCR